MATLFAAFLGYNPIQTLLGPGIHAVSAHQQHILLGHTFFPSVISGPFIGRRRPPVSEEPAAEQPAVISQAAAGTS